MPTSTERLSQLFREYLNSVTKSRRRGVYGLDIDPASPNQGTPPTGWKTTTITSATNHPLLDGVQNNDTAAGTPTRGDVITVPASGLWTRLPKGSSGQYLRSNGTDILYSAIQAADIAHALLDGAIDNDTAAGTPTRGDLISVPASAKWTRLALGTTGQYPRSNGTDVLYSAIQQADLPALGITEYSPGNPTATSSTSLKMMGLGSTIKFTPIRTGNLMVALTYVLKNTTTGDGVNCQGKQGTGAIPANGDAASGNSFGTFNSFYPVTGGQVGAASSIDFFVGLALSTQCWFDMAIDAITGGTASVLGVAGFVGEF